MEEPQVYEISEERKAALEAKAREKAIKRYQTEQEEKFLSEAEEAVYRSLAPVALTEELVSIFINIPQQTFLAIDGKPYFNSREYTVRRGVFEQLAEMAWRNWKVERELNYPHRSVGRGITVDPRANMVY